MAKLLCPISGIRYSCEHLPLHTTYIHPIFSVPYKRLLPLYQKDIAGHLTPTDNYLLFLAYLNTIDALEWRTACSLVPTAADTQALVYNNMAQLLAVLEKTVAITIPSFKQPGFIIDAATADLANIHVYIEAWQKNIYNLETGYKQERINRKLKEVEDKLQYLIMAGEDQLSANKLAVWADLAGTFPSVQREQFQKIIRSCYNQDKMFALKLSSIEEVKDFCLENIMPGSIYLHKLVETLNNGIELNKSYLGYTILDTTAIGSQESEEIAILVAKAPEKKPEPEDYTSRIEYIKAKLRYQVAASTRSKV